VLIEGWREEVWAVVAVSDRGPGVAQEQCQQLFEAFFRGDLSRKLGTGGSGLGLYLVRKLTEAHGGHVRAMPRRGGGLTIELRLPLLGESVERETMRLSKSEVNAALERETGQHDPGGG
jgi:two-component system sensor histidine kinase BaeS